MTPIVTSLADTDLYKVTMAQGALHQFPGTMAEFTFQCRSKVDLRPFVREIREAISLLGDLRFEPEELEFLAGLRYLKSDFIALLRNLRLDPRQVKVSEGAENLEIVAEGPWLNTTWFEIHVLEIVAEIYHRQVNAGADMVAAEAHLRKKCEVLRKGTQNDAREFRLIEFGTRRRFSKGWQRRVLEVLLEEVPGLVWGTSNVRLAMEHGIRPVGTMAHEWLQAGQGTDARLSESQSRALDAWAQEYRGDLGIALSDIFGVDAFLADFDLYFAKLFDGVRHDSGDPFLWTEKILGHFRKLSIPPQTKAVVYSDGLTMELALALWNRFEGQLRTSFGIGTHLTCDLPGVSALNIVMKMTRCNGQPVAKLSDSEGKTMCKDQEFLAYLKRMIAHKVGSAFGSGGSQMP